MSHHSGSSWFEIWTADVRQACLQSDEPMKWPIFIEMAVSEYELGKDKALRLKKPLHGLSEPCDLWFDTLKRIHRDELRMEALRSNATLYASQIKGRIIGLSDTYVDDIFRAGSWKFCQMSQTTKKRFYMEDDENIPCVFTRCILDQKVMHDSASPTWII